MLSAATQKVHKLSKLASSSPGAQWPQMGVDLLVAFPVYRQTIQRLNAMLLALPDPPLWTLEGVLCHADERNINNAELSQSLSTATQIALVEQLKSWGIEPAVAVGHSSGEIAAAYAAGLLNMREAIVIAYLRGKHVTLNAHDGLMLAVGKGQRDLHSEISLEDKDVTVACINSPGSVTLSGKSTDILAVKAVLDESGTFNKVLSTGRQAYHSRHMKAAGFGYERAMIGQLGTEFGKAFRGQKADFISSVTGERLERGCLSANYWRGNLESPVLFQNAVEELGNEVHVDVWVEIGPHAALKSSLQQIGKTMAGSQRPEYVPTMVRKKDNVRNLLHTAGSLWTLGVKVNLLAVNDLESAASHSGRRKCKFLTDLPRYQWQYTENLRRENRMNREWRQRMHPRHDILGSRMVGGLKDEPLWRNILRLQDVPWLAHHRLSDQIVFPAAGFVSMALEAVTQTYEMLYEDRKSITRYGIHALTIDTPLIIPEDNLGIEVMLSLHLANLQNKRRASSEYIFRIISVLNSGDKDTFIEHAKGRINLICHDQDWSKFLPKVYGARTPISADRWYDTFAHQGLNYGPAFQGLSSIKALWNRGMAEARASLMPAETDMTNESSYVIHPAAMDTFLQLSIIASHSGVASRLKSRYVPVEIEDMIIRPPRQRDIDQPPTIEARLSERSVRGFDSTLTVTGSDQRVIVNIKNLRLTKSDSGLTHVSEQTPYSRMVWPPCLRFINMISVPRIFPLLQLQGAVIQRLNSLALLQLIQFCETHSELFQVAHEVHRLTKLLGWMGRKYESAQASQDWKVKKVLAYNSAERADVIAQQSSMLCEVSPECRLMCHIHNNYPAIFRGDISGIQVALQQNRLSDMYKIGSIIAEGNKRLASVVELMAHENSRLRMLEIGAGTGSATREILPRLRGDTVARRYKSYAFTDVTSSFLHSAMENFGQYGGITFSTFDMEDPARKQCHEAQYDVVIASNVVHVTSDILSTLQNLRTVLETGGKLILLEITEVHLSFGIILGTFSDFWSGATDPSCPRYDGPFISKEAWESLLPQADFSGVDFILDDYADQPSSSVIVATAINDQRMLHSPQLPQEQGIMCIYRNEITETVRAFGRYAEEHGHAIDFCEISSSSPLRYRKLVFFLEIERSAPFFLDARDEEWEGLKHYLNEAESTLWLTNGDLLSGGAPPHAMIGGILRGLKTENSQRNISALDLDCSREVNFSKDICELILGLAAHSTEGDCDGVYTLEYRYKNGVVFTSSLEPDNELNEAMMPHPGTECKTGDATSESHKKRSLGSQVSVAGSQAPLTHFNCEAVQCGLGSDEVKITSKAFAADSNSFINTDGILKGFSGIITATGEDVQGLVTGDYVFGMYFDQYCAALYGLYDLASLEQGESILVQNADCALGLAVIQLAKRLDATIYATVSEQTGKASQIREKEVAERNIFLETEDNVAEELRSATYEAGVDILFSCEPVQGQAHIYWRCLKSFGRVVEARTKDTTPRSVETTSLPPNVSLLRFDLVALCRHKPQTVQRLLTEVRKLYSKGKIAPLRSLVKSNAEINSDANGAKVVVNLPTASDSIKVGEEHESTMPLQHISDSLRYTFDPEATYLLVGCLTGLGQLFTRWMIERGARSLLFLSRSGDRKAGVREFLGELRTLHLDIKIAKGDVASFIDVEATISLSSKPIKGVVQAALMLQDQSFEKMSLATFDATMKPRVQGTLNLHEATKSCPLDFFLMWSSWTAIFGTATQTNYLASYSFMDAFARHRRSLDMPATSLILSRIGNMGAVGRDDLYAKNMTRNGFLTSDEDEFLRYFEAGILTGSTNSRNSSSLWHSDELTQAHLLVGIEAAGLRGLANKGHDIEQMGWYHDARFSNLIQSIDNLNEAEGDATRGAVAEHLDTSADGGDPVERVRKKVAQLLYLSLDNIDVKAPMSKYAMDSMIAAELRNWIFASFGKDVSLFKLLGPKMTVEGVVEDMELG